MQSIRITSRPPLGIRKWNQLSRFNRTSTKVIPIEINWIHFDDESRIQDMQQVKDQQLCILVFVAYQTIPSTY